MRNLTIEEYKDLLLEDELKIGYGIPEDEIDEFEDDSYIDGLMTDGFHEVYDPLDELFGEPITGYSLR